MLKRRKLPSKNRTKQITVKFAFKNSSVGDLQVESSMHTDGPATEKARSAQSSCSLNDKLTKPASVRDLYNKLKHVVASKIKIDEV